MRGSITLVLLAVSGLILLADVHSHGHSHHGHSHGQGSHHGHSHGGSHHGHSHGQGSHHGHSHGGSHHGHSHGKVDEEVHMYRSPPREGSSHVSRLVKEAPAVLTETLLATFIISALPFLILFLVPIESGNKRQPLLNVLLSFASGSMLADAFLHLIPHAIASIPSDAELDHPAYVMVGFWVLGGIMAFLIMEKLIRHFSGGHCHGHIQESTSDVVHCPEVQKDKPADDNGSESNLRHRATKKDSTKNEGAKAESKVGEVASTNHSHSKEDHKEDYSDVMRASGWLNLAADLAHNFTDGLAIGASFLVSRNVGIATTISMLFHEIPHEIGDFAILVQSGCSKKKAMLFQLATAVGAVAGAICGILFESSGSSVPWVLPFTAGGFIYIATVSVLPELLSEEHKTLWQTLKETLAMLTGFGLMVVILHLEEAS